MELHGEIFRRAWPQQVIDISQDGELAALSLHRAGENSSPLVGDREVELRGRAWNQLSEVESVGRNGARWSRNSATHRARTAAERTSGG